MTKQDILQWLIDIPDDAKLIAVASDEIDTENKINEDAAYACELFYDKETKRIVCVFG